MKYVPFTKSKPLGTDLPRGYISDIGYAEGLQALGVGNTPKNAATVADVATTEKLARDNLTDYLAMLDGHEILTLPGLPPSPYRVAPCATWKARGLHAAAWAAWWAAIARQRMNRAKIRLPEC